MSLIYRFLVRVSYLQIYNEDVCDLLGKDPTAKLEVKSFSLLHVMWIGFHPGFATGKGETRHWCVCEGLIIVHCEEPQ